jgi:hypothetical protein
VRPGVEGAEGRKFGRKVRMAELEHLLGERKVLEAVHAEVLQRGSLW